MLSTFLPVALMVFAMQAEGPVATSPEAPKAQPVAPHSEESPVPQGAPADDFGLVAWCQGALTGHMQLADEIKDVLPLDADTQAAGEMYLGQYKVALEAAAQNQTDDGRRRAAEARAAGLHVWDAARSAQNRDTQKWSYPGWQLPGRCEHAAARLTSGSDLMGAALKGAPAPAPAEVPADPAPTQPQA